MNKTVGLILAVFIFPLFPLGGTRGEEPPSPYSGKTADELLDEALRAIKMTRADLEFEKQYVDDSYRLHSVRDLLTKPLKLPEAAESVSAGAARFHHYTHKLLGIAARETDVPATELAGKTEAATFGEALKAVFAGSGEPLDSKKQKKAEDGFKALPDAVQKIVIELLSAIATALVEIREATANLSPAECDLLLRRLPALLETGGTGVQQNDAENLLTLTGKVQHARIFAAAVFLAEGIDTACRTLKSLPADKTWKTASFQCDTPFGPVVVRGTGNDSHADAGELLLLLDLGGDDSYSGVAGGARGKEAPVSVAIDLGGDDLYVSREPFRQGAGFLAVGCLVDVAGDDTYIGGNFCQGCGLLGVGVLRDLAGNDRLLADTCAQGFGSFGAGLLLDAEGNDACHAALYAQGVGSTCGFGLLHDLAGNDLYFTGGKYADAARYKDRYLSLGQGCGLGLKPVASGGIGVLMDSQGNDVYNADVFGQGVGYWFGAGMLIDLCGSDVYNAFQYSQGAGIHSGLGILRDDDGPDKYSSRSVSQGCGHDFAVGTLMDKSGGDSYSAGEMSQGAGSANGVGMLFDYAGDDCYAAIDDWYAQGGGGAKRDFGSIGVLLDLAGSDSYSSARSGFGMNNSIWTKTTWGVGMDVETK